MKLLEEIKDKEQQIEKALSIISNFNLLNRKKKKRRVKRILSEISDQELIQYIGMQDLPKIIYLLLLKHSCELQLIPIENDVMIRIAKTNVANMSYLAVYIHFIDICDKILKIEGNISLPVILTDKNTFFLRHNGRKVEIDLRECNLDCKLGDNIYENRSVFSVSIPLDSKGNEIEFFNCVEEKECRYGKINALRFSPVADCLEHQYSRFEDWMLCIEENRLVCNEIRDERIWKQAEQQFQESCMRLNPQASDMMELRSAYWRSLQKKTKPIWILMDRPDRADDNAEVFFRYMQQHKEVDTYFIIDENCRDYPRIAAIGKTIALYSKEHLLLSLLADYVISSQCNGVVENPFWENAEYFRDLYHRPKLIFLQHGVIKDDMSQTLNRFHTNLTGFITSTKAEYDSIFEYPYFYDKENVWLTGLPVFDTLTDHSEKIILIMPTWRKELMHQEWDDASQTMQWVPNKDMEQSEYYRKYFTLLHDRKLLNICKKYGYQIAFKPHPLIEKYIGNIAGDEILLFDASVTYREALEKGSMLITDYSSVAFLFAYLKKPIIYYQFDKESFFRSHTYRKGYFDYEKDGLGKCCRRKGELINCISQYVKQNCEVEEIYQKRMDTLYLEKNEGCCENIYKRIMKENSK